MTAKPTEAGDENAALRLAVQVSEMRYRVLLGALSEVVLLADAGGLVVGPQSSWSVYTGQTAAESAGRGWLDAVHREDLPDLEAAWSAGVAAAEPFAVACRIRHSASAGHRHCEGRVVPLRDEPGAIHEWVVAFADVEDRIGFEERRRAGAERLQRLIDSNVVAICYGIDDRIVDGNSAFLDLLRADRSDLKGGLALTQLLAADDRPADPSSFAAGEAHEHAVHRFDGSTGYLLTAGAMLSPDPGWLAVVVDITDRKRAEQTARKQALHDPLTGLPNRRLLVDRLDHALSAAARTGSLVGVAFCDLDRFKAINDTYGHAAGDRVLKEVARRLSALSRDADTVARVGGDEFVVVIENLERPEDAMQIAERIRLAIARALPGDQEPSVTASIGLAFSNGAQHDREALLGQADDAMYKAKQAGRNRVTVITGDDLGFHGERRWIEHELSRALSDDSLGIAFQPVIDLRSRQAVAAEALLRWTLGGRPVSAARTISVAEATGIITRVSDWVVSHACREFGRWRNAVAAPGEWTVHVNISARDLADGRCVSRILGAIDEGGCLPSDVCLEVTETAVWHDPKSAYKRLAELRAKGVCVAIDDFGTGYASLNNLREVPADIVKIDRCFVAELSRSPRDQAIMKYAIGLAHELDLVVVAEGIETAAQLAILAELGCDQGQGYLFGRPQPIEALRVALPDAVAAAFRVD